MDPQFFVAVLSPKIDGLDEAARTALVCERVKDAAHVHVEKYTPFGPYPVPNEIAVDSARRALNSGATHFVLLATDYLPVDGFLTILDKVVRARPEDFISLQAGPVAQALEPGWYTSCDGLTAACVVPMPVLKSFMAFYDEALNEYGKSGSFDMNLVLYAQYLGALIWHTVPSLVTVPEGCRQPFEKAEDYDAIEWGKSEDELSQVFVGRESANAHWRLIGCLEPEFRKIRQAYDLEGVKPILGAKLKAKIEAKNTPKEFACPDSMMPFVRQVVAGEYDFTGMPLAGIKTVLDLGANLGAFALFAKRRFPGARVECYEPHPDNFKLLTHNVRTFEIDASLHEVAVTNAEGPLKLYDGKNNCGEASTHALGEQAETFHEVATMKPAELPPADIMKIDTEGCEWEILRDYKHYQGLKAVMLEWHSKEDKARIVEFLLSKGFDLLKDDVHREDRGVLCFARAA